MSRCCFPKFVTVETQAVLSREDLSLRMYPERGRGGAILRLEISFNHVQASLQTYAKQLLFFLARSTAGLNDFLMLEGP